MDLITHVPSLSAMLAEAIAIQSDEDSALAKYFTIDENGQGATFNVDKIPVVHSNNGETVCLVRGVSRAVIESSSSIIVLGECIDKFYCFDSPESQATYERVKGPREVTYIDENGEKQTRKDPYKMGVFA